MQNSARNIVHKFFSTSLKNRSEHLRTFGKIKDHPYLAELVGVHWKTIGHVERGSYPIALTTFARLSQFLDTGPNRLLDGLKPPDPQRTAHIKKALAHKRAPPKMER